MLLWEYRNAICLSQVIDDIFNDRFPLTYEEAVYLTALRAHVELGEFQDNHYMDYELVPVGHQLVPVSPLSLSL